MDIAALKQAAEAATPGPWTVNEHIAAVEVVHPARNDGDGKTALAFLAGYFGDHQRPNAEFIARANPQAVLELIASHERLVSALKNAKDAAHSVLIAGGDYGDDLSDMDLRRILKASNIIIEAALAAAQ